MTQTLVLKATLKIDEPIDQVNSERLIQALMRGLGVDKMDIDSMVLEAIDE